MILNSFQVSAPGQPMVYGLQGWREAFRSPGILSAIYNTFSLALARQFIALILGIVQSTLGSRLLLQIP
jgi:iron(III) transport system permease protein